MISVVYVPVYHFNFPRESFTDHPDYPDGLPTRTTMCSNEKV